MTTVAEPGARQAPALDLSRGALSKRRRIVDTVAKGGIWFAVALAVIPIALVMYYVIAKGASVIDYDFLTGRLPRQLANPGGGIGPAIAGTLLMTGVASLIAIPLGVLGAIYLNEYGKQNALARTIRVMANVMTGVPSVVMGLFIYTAVVLSTEQSGLAGALALACLMLPVVIRSSEEMLRLVPDELRQASLALGARKWRTILTVVLPAAISGIASGSLLAVARAAGETAPIVLVVGLTNRINWSLDGSNTALPVQIYRNATEPFQAATDRAWGAALTLVVLVLAFTLLGRLVASRFAIKER
ncbi:phosphate ABC transporter permease PstA [Dactylosporangium aurantiacum]|uniref:Phosphate transport system permease protein PstA n=1 Tax=Dactylosporangium aurantiacum TaxID=35754 RepID=A0A9Q9I855_9ACTN|nr:phosphate ABC transporter permease PstA [Dactylosporangium aurantiacum]MDG6108731.1 phosphate ABC transporter permease PstA [Dactylosporangium aurantiacum]UWZ51092.1 phosphate ABC transporter permease PstA [Dactylosporangium aurantiacum]